MGCYIGVCKDIFRYIEFLELLGIRGIIFGILTRIIVFCVHIGGLRETTIWRLQNVLEVSRK